MSHIYLIMLSISIIGGILIGLPFVLSYPLSLIFSCGFAIPCSILGLVWDEMENKEKPT